MKEYQYDTRASCATGYGVHLYTGVFQSPHGAIIPILESTLSGPWGRSGRSNAIGSGFNPVPETLKVGFFSETEDKFYEGEFPLPYETLEQMFQEENDNPFWKGQTFDDSQSGRTLKHMKYDGLEIGITLGGKVTLWISGQESRIQKEIGYFQAGEAQVNWRDVFEYGEREESFKYGMDKVFTPKVKTKSLPKLYPFGYGIRINKNTIGTIKWSCPVEVK